MNKEKQTIDGKEYETLDTIFQKCPICKKGKVISANIISTFLIFKSKTAKIFCDKCKAEFEEIEKPELKDIEKCYKLDLSNSKEESKYNNKILKKSEWERGISDLDCCIKNNILPTLTILDSKIILDKGEKVHHAGMTILAEERAVRYSGGGAVRVARGVYIGGSRGTSSGEVKEIDRGNLILTNNRLLFNGHMRSSNIDLNKITIVEEDGDDEEGGHVEIGTSNRQKSQFFCVDEPEKWAAYIKIAIKKIKE